MATKLVLRYNYGCKNHDKLVCSKCRNSNQNTDDAADGLVFCKFSEGIMGRDSECAITVSTSGHSTYLFEPFDGTNCTWTVNGDFVFEIEFSPAKE